MANLKAIQTLTDLSAKQAEQAASRLAKANQVKQQADQKLNLLAEFRESYVEQFKNQTTLGLSVSDYQNYQKFIASLNLAIQQQQQIVHNNTLLLKKLTTEWQLQERKKYAYQTLGQRAETQLLHLQNKREQQQSDEQASRVKLIRL